MVCLLAALWVQLSVSTGNGWPHNALRHHWLMPISCHFRDCKALLITSLTHVSGAIASVQIFTFTLFTYWLSCAGGSDVSSGRRTIHTRHGRRCWRPLVHRATTTASSLISMARWWWASLPTSWTICRGFIRRYVNCSYHIPGVQTLCHRFCCFVFLFFLSFFLILYGAPTMSLTW